MIIMYILVDGEKIISGPDLIQHAGYIQINDWPSLNGQPCKKSEVYWTGSIVAVKTYSMQVADYKTKKFEECNEKIIKNLMYIKKLKKLDDVNDLFINEYVKSQTSFAEVDASIAFIETDLFEA